MAEGGADDVGGDLAAPFSEASELEIPELSALGRDGFGARVQEGVDVGVQRPVLGEGGQPLRVPLEGRAGDIEGIVMDLGVFMSEDDFLKNVVIDNLTNKNFSELSISVSLALYRVSDETA